MNLLSTEAYRLNAIAKLSDTDFKNLIVQDSEYLNQLAQSKQIDVSTLMEVLNDPKEIKQLRSNAEFGKNIRIIEKFLKDVLQEYQKTNKSINFDIPNIFG